MQRLDLYRQLELISSTPEPLTYFNPKPTRWQRLARGVQALWQRSVKSVLGSSDPVIQEFRDSKGDRYFKVYDPITQSSQIVESESELRVWIERRYLQ
ncbi:MAG: hypothetical protein HC881_19710 [Leptolyngbyaceae cyanobacterium SL_7_1]|nr:hypothetical protein [Leptolyngbyaceae cyanobacterium SL_7_1]